MTSFARHDTQARKSPLFPLGRAAVLTTRRARMVGYSLVDPRMFLNILLVPSNVQLMAPPSYVTVDALLDPDVIVQLGVAPVRVDVLSSFATISFREAWRQRRDAAFGSVPAHYLGREHLIREKVHFNRPQDRADVAALEAVPVRTKAQASRSYRHRSHRRERPARNAGTVSVDESSVIDRAKISSMMNTCGARMS